MKRFFGLVGLGLVVLVGVLVYRALTFTLEQGPLPPAVAVAVDDEAAVARLAAALRIPTVANSAEPHFDPASFDALHAHLRASFPNLFTTLSTEAVNRDSLIFTWQGTDPELKPILLMAHQDVVPVDTGTEPAWSRPPFAGQVADGWIVGRGALDVKSGLMGILEAVELLVKAGHRPKRTVYLAFGHDEELGGTHGAKVVAKRFAERGVHFEFVLDEGGSVVEGVVPGVKGPVALVGVAEKGYVSLRLSAEGAGGHSSMPPPRTAVGVVAQAVTRLEQSPFPAHIDHAGRFFAYVGPKMPFDRRIVFANLWLFEPLIFRILSGTPSMNASIRTTTAPTMMRGGVKDNVLPVHAEAVVNFRILPGETPATVKTRVEAVIDDPAVEVEEVEGFGDDPSPLSDVRSTSFALVRDAIRQAAQDPELVVAPYLTVGATDSRYFQGITDNTYRYLHIRLGPDDLARLHGTDERISVANYLEMVRFYYLLIRNAT